MRGGHNGASSPAPQPKGWPGRRQQTEVPAARERRLPFPSRLRLGVVLAIALAGLVLWQVPQLQVEPARQRLAAEEQLSASERLLLDKELFQAENAARATLALILATGSLLVGLGVVWRRFEASRQLRSHERFASAIEQLASERADGSPRTETRLGGIYALERIAQESSQEYWPVMEVLTAYVRENAAWKASAARTERPQSTGTPRGPEAARGTRTPRPAADIQAVLGVLGRRASSLATGERRLLDLRDADLRGANLSGARLEGINLQGAHLAAAEATRAGLSRANLREADLGGASLSEADLEGAALARANLEGARLNGANLRGADLSGANLRGADLWEANLKGCNLKDADLRGADLSQALLEEAILWRADLQDATLKGARLKETHLERANLAGVVGLTWEQGEDAYTDENTILPDYLQPGGARPPASPAALPPPAPLAPRPVRRARPAARRPAPRGALGAAAPPPAPPSDGSNIVELPAATRRGSAPKKKPAASPKKATQPGRRKRPRIVES